MMKEYTCKHCGEYIIYMERAGIWVHEDGLSQKCNIYPIPVATPSDGPDSEGLFQQR